MGRYDGPYFEVDNERVVSVWASKVPWNDIPEDYWTYNFGGGDDDPWNRFSTDFGFGYYDDDFVESYFDESRNIVPIRDLITPLSYSPSFIDDLVRRSIEVRTENTSYVFLMYHFKYDPGVTRIDESTYFKFVGVFAYTEGDG